MQQQIQFITASDGVNLAVATVGSGPPLVIVPGWISHLELDWDMPHSHDLWDRLARNHLVVRYDKRNTGLSGRGISDCSLEAHTNDLSAIVKALALGDVALLGYSEGGPISIAYTVQHAENVSQLILYGTYHDGSAVKFHQLSEAFVPLIRADWGGFGAATMIEVFVPGAPPQARAQFAEYQRQAATAEDAAGALVRNLELKVSALLPEVRVPTLVLHRRGDRACPVQQGRELAARISGARFVPLDGDIHIISLGDTEPLVAAIEDFLSNQEDVGAAAKGREGLQTILFTDMESSTALTQSLGDAKAQELVRAHNTVVREALAANAGLEIKHTGDGIMASFSTASSALACVVAIQRAVAARAEEQPDIPLRLRIGLNAGEPVVEEQDLFGSAVQLARRICDHAEPGQILAPIVVRELAAGKGFLFSDQGEVALRGFEDPVRLYEVRWREEG